MGWRLSSVRQAVAHLLRRVARAAYAFHQPEEFDSTASERYAVALAATVTGALQMNGEGEMVCRWCSRPAERWTGKIGHVGDCPVRLAELALYPQYFTKG